MAALNVDPQVLLDAISNISDAERMAFNRVVWEEYIVSGSITEYHNIVTGVRCGAPIPYGNKKQGYGFMQNAASLASQCDDILTEVGAALSTKQWNPGLYTNTLELCYADIECKMREWFSSEKCNSSDPIGTQYWNFLVSLVGEQLRNSHWAKTYFGATTSTSAALNGHNGVFTQYLGITNTNTDQRIAIAENAGATYVAQKLADDTGFETFRDMHERAEDSFSLRSKGMLPIKSTRALATNYLRWLRNNKQVGCCEFDTNSNMFSLDNINIFGRPIKIIDEWDEIIMGTSPDSNGVEVPHFAELNDGTKYTSPHRAVITYKENEPIGTCDSGELSEMKIKHDEYTEKTKIKCKYDFDVKVLKETDFILAM